MPVPDLILQKPLVLIQPGGTVIDGYSNDNPLNFGEIALINELSDAYEVGDNVAFYPSGGTTVNYGGVDYILVSEKNILYREIPAP